MTLHMGNRHDRRAPRLPGELIVRNGPDRGVSRVLLVPLTLVGSGEACDLRIIDPLVRSVHCVISVTPEGPHLRSVGGSTLVNNTPSSSRMLAAGDRLTIGEIELEIRWAFPPGPFPGSGAGIPLAKLAEEEESPEEPPMAIPARKSARQHWKLVQGRGRLFRDRLRLEAETNHQFRQITEVRLEGESLQAEARTALDELRKLRRRFIRRWKRQWTAERQRLASETARLKADRAAFDEEKARFEATRSQEERARQTLAKSLQECRAKRQAMEIELQARQQELADREHLLNAREGSLTREQADFASQRVALGHEIAALENRVNNLREALPASEATIPLPPETVVPEEAVPLHVLADDLADQQYSLGELVGHVARALTDARSLGSNTLEELEAILRNVLGQEESLHETARQLLTEQARLETWQARLLDSQINHERDEQDLAIREHRVERYEGRLKSLIAEWQRRRKAELAVFHDQLEHARLLRDQAAEAIRRTDDREAELAVRRETLAGRELAVELARTELGESDSEALARGERKILALHEAREERLEELIGRLKEEREGLAVSFRQATEQWEALARQQRILARKQTQFDHREYLADRATGDEAARMMQLQADRATAERHADELRQELTRLTKFVEQLSRPDTDAKRAA
ncbi:FHA domain-containing protein [Zavarzinella formosa]|uniref:FHA domain-containing protein n=1 Tax=Zavarzinella formosa TaxID=360055 RepID=UPI0002F6240D|nr:FHA domain-containing protein [Zavarzinella formosa]